MLAPLLLLWSAPRRRSDEAPPGVVAIHTLVLVVGVVVVSAVHGLGRAGGYTLPPLSRHRPPVGQAMTPAVQLAARPPYARGSPEHRRYLRSPEWEAKRLKVFARDGYQCAGCGRRVFDTRKLQAHHKREDYSRLGCERLEDLETVCSRCHARLSR